MKITINLKLNFTSTGKLVSEGLMDGERFVYYANGQVAEKKNYKNGNLDRVSQWYSEKNVVLKELFM